MDRWELLIGWILGLVEGLTEFAPISSTGHMILVDELLFHSDQLWGQEVANTFKVVIQLGSILAVVVIFWQRFLQLLGIKQREVDSQEKLGMGHILVGLTPVLVIGILLEDLIDTYLFSAFTVVIGLIMGSFLMIFVEKKGTQVNSHHLDQITYKQALGIGLFQCLALWPGFSRSGSTIAGGLVFGANHRTSSEFSFIMAVPVMLGASILKLTKNWAYLSWELAPLFILGFVTAFIVALISIHLFLQLVNTWKLTPFAYCRLLLVGVILLFLTVV